MSELNDFRRHLHARGRRHHYPPRILAAALREAKRRQQQAAQYALERRQRWVDAHRPQQAVVEDQQVLMYSLPDTPMSTPPEGAVEMVERIVIRHALEEPGMGVPLATVYSELEREGVIGRDVTRACVHEAHAQRRIAVLGKDGRPASCYPMP
jgi:hypothetical protein